MCLYTSWRTNRRHAPRACAVYSRQARRGENQSETELCKLFRKCLHLVSLGVEEGISSLLHEPSVVGLALFELLFGALTLLLAELLLTCT